MDATRRDPGMSGRRMSGRRERRPLTSNGPLANSLERWWVFRLEHAATALRAASLQALEGIDLAQVAALTVLSDLGGMSIAALGERVGVDRTTISRLVRRLEEDTLVECSRHPLDARKLIVDATSIGREAVAEAHDRLRRVEGTVFATFDDYELDDLRDALRRLEPAPAPR